MTDSVLPPPTTVLQAARMAVNSIRKGSEFDPLPGKPLTGADRDALALRAACRRDGTPLPPVAAPYNGWDRPRRARS